MPATRNPSVNRSTKSLSLLKKSLLTRGSCTVVRPALQQLNGHRFGLRIITEKTERGRECRKPEAAQRG
jgi:hypothetical protein